MSSGRMRLGNESKSVAKSKGGRESGSQFGEFVWVPESRFAPKLHRSAGPSFSQSGSSSSRASVLLLVYMNELGRRRRAFSLSARPWLLFTQTRRPRPTTSSSQLLTWNHLNSII